MRKRIAIILIGPQGSGKGTQAQILMQKYALCYIAGGNITRELAGLQNSMGKEARALMDQGQLLPDDIINHGAANLIEKCLGENSLLFDGYPRNINQANWLIQYLSSHITPGIIIKMDLDDQAAIQRIGKRLICPNCGFVVPPSDVEKLQKSGSKCPNCRNALQQRSDDTPESVKQRLKTYHEHTEPIIQLLAEHFELYHVDAAPSIENIATQIDTTVKKLL